AERVLPELGVPGPEILETARLIRLTFTHDPYEEDHGGKVLCDADLEVLARNSGAYQRYLQAIRQDFQKVTDEDFAVGREKFLRRMLARNPIFNTAIGRRRWERPARRNLMSELYPRRSKVQD